MRAAGTVGPSKLLQFSVRPRKIGGSETFCLTRRRKRLSYGQPENAATGEQSAKGALHHVRESVTVRPGGLRNMFAKTLIRGVGVKKLSAFVLAGMAALAVQTAPAAPI